MPSTSEWSYVFAAYAVTWVAIVGYALHLGVRRRNASRRLTLTEGR